MPGERGNLPNPGKFADDRTAARPDTGRELAETEVDTMKRRHVLNQAEVYRLPQPPAARPAPRAFVICPPGILQGMSAAQWMVQQWIYCRALEEARAVVAPSLPERDLLAVWN
jgi:hypothetical protein